MFSHPATKILSIQFFSASHDAVVYEHLKELIAAASSLFPPQTTQNKTICPWNPQGSSLLLVALTISIRSYSDQIGRSHYGSQKQLYSFTEVPKAKKYMTGNVRPSTDKLSLLATYLFTSCFHQFHQAPGIQATVGIRDLMDVSNALTPDS